MPYTKDKDGNTIYITQAKFNALEAAKDQDRDPCPPDQTLCRDGICRNLTGIQKHNFKSGKDWNGKPKQKGTKNKRTLKDIVKEDALMTPAEILLHISNDESVNLNQRIDCAGKAAKFFDPALSSTEVKVETEDLAPFKVTVNTGHGKTCKCEECVPVDKDKGE